MKRLALFLDGTWNDPEDNTNVWRLKLLTADRGDDGVRQTVYYDEGVGTTWYERFRGGAFGVGLSANVRQAYQWLMQHHDDGDQIFVFGFSRGAFTARSLCGLIARCGLLRPTSPMSVGQLFERYRDSAKKRPIYELGHLDEEGKRTDFSREDDWLLEHSRRVDIQFLGVWDTVGALGVPGIGGQKHRFHNTNPSKIYRNLVQALAIDEHRRHYSPTLWTVFVPDGTTDVAAEIQRRVRGACEQRWFAGAHANVGGGYRNNSLASIPLRWMQDKAASAGLAFRAEIHPVAGAHVEDLTDSYAEFMGGLYPVFTAGQRHYRTIARAPLKVSDGTSHSLNETVDDSVLRRWKDRKDYRPKNLRYWVNKTDLELAD